MARKRVVEAPSLHSWEDVNDALRQIAEAQIKTYLVRMANRVDFYASLRGLSPSEVEGYLTDFQIEPEALVELKARACNMQTGCFRLLDRTLSNVRRILKETGEETVTVKTIAQASSMMML